MSIITKDTVISDILEKDSEKYSEILMDNGLHCLACPISNLETLEEACQTHGIDLDILLKQLND